MTRGKEILERLGSALQRKAQKQIDLQKIRADPSRCYIFFPSRRNIFKSDLLSGQLPLIVYLLHKIFRSKRSYFPLEIGKISHVAHVKREQRAL